MLALPLVVFAFVSLVTAAGMATEHSPRAPETLLRRVEKAEGLRKRQDATAPGAIAVIGNSNPAPAKSDLNTVAVDSASTGDGGVIKPFARLARRASQLSKSEASFSSRRRAKRQVQSAKVAVGSDNPSPASSDLNANWDDNIPTKGSSANGITDFKSRFRRARLISSPSNDKVKRACQVKARRSLEPRLPQPHQLNMVSHTIAARGFADGTIEPLPVAKASL